MKKIFCLLVICLANRSEANDKDGAYWYTPPAAGSAIDLGITSLSGNSTYTDLSGTDKTTTTGGSFLFRYLYSFSDVTSIVR